MSFSKITLSLIILFDILSLIKKRYLRYYNNKMYISNKKYKLAQLTRQYVEVSSILMGKMFHTHNNIWNTIGPDESEVISFMKDKLNQMLDWEQKQKKQGHIAKDVFLNFVYLDDQDKVVGAWTNFQLINYLQNSSKISLPAFSVLQTHGLQLQKSIRQHDKIRGKSIYGMFIAIDQALMGTGVVVLFNYDVLHYFHTHGFQVFYGRSSNIKSFKLIMKYGAEMTAETTIEQKSNERINELKLYFVRFQTKNVVHMKKYVDEILEKQQ